MFNKPPLTRRRVAADRFCLTFACAVSVPIMASFLAPTLALADSQDTFYITADVTEQYDDNLFRLPSSVDLSPLIGRSSSTEFITTTSVMFNLNKAYSLQRFELQAGVSDYRYRNFSYLGFLAKPYKGVWHWSLTPSLTGKLLTERQQSATSFTDYRGYNKSNVVTSDRSRFDAELEVAAAWRLLGGVSTSKNESTEQDRDEDDSQSDSVEFGFAYRLPSGNSVSYVGRQARGEYINRPDPNAFNLIDNAFDETEHALSAKWVWSGKTELDARIAYLKREHDNYPIRDFDGLTGNANINWQITGSTQLRAGLSRQLASDQTFYSSYAQTDRLMLAPYWQIGQKTALSLRYEIARRDYEGAIVQTSYNGRRDTTRTATLAVDWNPMRDLTLNTSLRRDERESNVPGLEYVSNMVFVSARIAF